MELSKRKWEIERKLEDLLWNVVYDRGKIPTPPQTHFLFTHRHTFMHTHTHIHTHRSKKRKKGVVKESYQTTTTTQSQWTNSSAVGKNAIGM